MSYDTIPSNASLKPKPFKAHVSDDELNDFKNCLKYSHIGPKTYENLTADPKEILGWGIKREWLADAKDHWLNKYDWRKTEDRINKLPNYTVGIEDVGFDFQVHFMALFSKKADAVPLTLLHGWPGSFLEFLSTVEVLKEKYTPETLPFHVIVPSLPGYGYSNGPPLDKDFDCEGIARVMDKLMVGLGFGKGYVTQGGDIGSFVSRILGVSHEACKAVHLNLAIGVGESKDAPYDKLTEAEKKGADRGKHFSWLGDSYANEHGTRPATVGLVLASSPVATLAWIGEKFIQWSDVAPPLDEILDSVTLYWFTDSFPRAIYPYRQFFGPKPSFFHPDPNWYIKKPMGYSWNPQELAAVPKDWVKETGNMVWYREHTEGGHFMAMETPKAFVKDMEDFIAQVWPDIQKGKL
ncbi:hypothetical protein LTR78_001212 [Recurvomyces mirabilis]|uniref:Epoxide hydrolase N-terminal domain-containing protein n=1 Tax=Recurvomyces mirabilis TaxID=574656 RepID=A0AAE0WVT9_9PEZI|nr:hypothetical protein LTR78_001212 [Recurvomyces mirabilis]KAK5161188.1 hypothetical protein LTS14_000984 [Recurvomyces mirabilis]